MKTVLIIEDNQDIRENTIEILELKNYKVLAAENGKIGLALAKTHLPDIIVCDLMMPELDGYQVLESLRQDETTLAIPFVFFTASVEKKSIEKALSMGANAYIRKPFETDELSNILAGLLR